MSYKDKTWCPDVINKKCKLRNGCPRILDSKDKFRIKESNILVSYFADKPSCFKEKKTYA